MKNLLSVFAFLIPMFFAFANPQSPETSCPAPSNVHVTGTGTGSISFDWDNCNCFSTGYSVKYQRLSDGYTSPVIFVTSSDYTFSGLQVGDYKFFFVTQCGGEESSFICIEDRVMN
jgi:hypothetical protein